MRWRSALIGNGHRCPAPSPSGHRDNSATAAASGPNDFNLVFPKLAAGVARGASTWRGPALILASPRSLAGGSCPCATTPSARCRAAVFTVTETQTDDLQPGIAKVVRGTFEVPLYLTGDGGPGSRMTFSPSAASRSRRGRRPRTHAVLAAGQGDQENNSVPVVYDHGLSLARPTKPPVFAGAAHRSGQQLGVLRD